MLILKVLMKNWKALIKSDVDELKWRSMTSNNTISGIKLEPKADAERTVKQFIKN